jgi:hypothetical protein
MQVPLGYALALAAVFGAPVRVAGQVMDSLGVATRGEDLLGVFLGQDAPRPEEPREPGVPRFEPRNLTFADGLADWEFGGSFRDEHSHAADYACTARRLLARPWPRRAPQPPAVLHPPSRRLSPLIPHSTS